MATAAPPLPPEIQDQQSPEAAQSVFAQQGIGAQAPPPAAPGGAGAQPAQMLAQQIQKLEEWLRDTMGIVKSINPALQAFLAPIANAGAEMQKAAQDMAKRSGAEKGSPVVPPPPPQNPAAGPPNPNAM